MEKTNSTYMSPCDEVVTVPGLIGRQRHHSHSVRQADTQCQARLLSFRTHRTSRAAEQLHAHGVRTGKPSCIRFRRKHLQYLDSRITCRGTGVPRNRLAERRVPSPLFGILLRQAPASSNTTPGWPGRSSLPCSDRTPTIQVASDSWRRWGRVRSATSLLLSKPFLCCEL